MQVDVDSGNVTFREEDVNKKNSLYVETAHLLYTPSHVPVHHMPLDLDNGLPGVVLQIGKTHNEDTISFLDHVNIYAAMKTVNLLSHKYIMTKHPSLVAEFIRYDDADPFDPIILQCAVAGLVKVENDNGKLTAIVCYWTPYTFTDGKTVLLSFGLGDWFTVRSIIRLTTICQWGCMLDLGNYRLIAPAIEMAFPLIFEQSKNGLPEGVKFDACDFRSPPMNNVNTDGNVVGALQLTGAITDGCDEDVYQDGITKLKIVSKSSTNG